MTCELMRNKFKHAKSNNNELWYINITVILLPDSSIYLYGSVRYVVIMIYCTTSNVPSSQNIIIIAILSEITLWHDHAHYIITP